MGYVGLYYLPQADLLTDPVLASPGLVSSALQLLVGAGWRCLLRLTPSSWRRRPKWSAA